MSGTFCLMTILCWLMLGKNVFSENSTLQLVVVFFRHGNRTANGPSELYPKDPYLNETYFPYGLGQLSNAGKVKEFLIGEALHNKYNTFLGPYYFPELIQAQSTDYNRTKMSLELVLASLFPPQKAQIWNAAINWQPIPFNYQPLSKDKILNGIGCPNYQKDYEEYILTKKYQDGFDRHAKEIEYICENTGLNITKFLDIYNLYFGLSTEEEWGFKLPEWTTKVWPDFITKLAIQEYFVQTATIKLKRMAVGYFLDKVLADMHSKIKNSKSKIKLYLYSAHENNVAEPLLALGLLEPPHVPPYGSYVVMELHKVKNTHGLKIYYENYTGNGPQLMKIPGCAATCEIDKFESLFEDLLHVDDNLCGS